jgi:hypothetical protein
MEPAAVDQNKGFETFQGVGIRVGTIEQLIEEALGVKLSKRETGDYSVMPGGTRLGIEKFKKAVRKWYRLVWFLRGRVWLAAEDTTAYRTRGAAIEAGRDLSEKTGAFFLESI